MNAPRTSQTAPAHTPHRAELDSIDSPAVTRWAAEWTASTCAAIDQAQPGARERVQAELLEALDADTRIPFCVRRGEVLFNFWRDRDHPRGVWRTTTLESFLSESPTWRTLIDVDALALAEQENWVWKGAHVREPGYDRALIRLSRGGSDATVVREFDVSSRSFVTDRPFNLPEAKSDVSWETKDTVILGTNVGAESLTASGYPARVYRWHRGSAPTEAELLFAGDRGDVASGGWADTTPGYECVRIYRALDMFRAEHYVLRGTTLERIPVPDDCDIRLHRGQLYLLPRTACNGVPSGGVGIVELDAFLADPAMTARVLFAPGPRQSLQSLRFTAHFLLVRILDDVSTRILRAPLSNPEALETVPLPPLTIAQIIDTSPLDDATGAGDEVWVRCSSFTQPDMLIRAQADEPESFRTPAKQAPTMFNSEGMTTRQYWARSADGTPIPYFITGQLDSLTAPRPCLVHAYGGFEVSLLPSYSPTTGIGWLNKGYVAVQANLRGGGEFGPEWHTCAIKENRHKVFEDYRAVLEDVVRRGFTTPAQLGIAGGSNGGLLTAVALTSFPECFGAAVSEVPLTDMLRYHRFLAGASWIAEYGDPDDPHERDILRSYSPLQRIVSSETRRYPPCLVTTSTRDDRVHPTHARSFAAALAAAGQPVDYVENSEGGHAGAATNEQTAWMKSIVYTWLEQQLTGSNPAGTDYTYPR